MDGWWHDRSRWWDAIAAEFAAYCGSRREELARRLEDAPTGGDLAAALLVAGACTELRAGVPQDVIVKRIVASLGIADGSALAADLVRHVARDWAARGVPIAQWWDPDLLLRSLIEYVLFTAGAAQPAATMELLGQLLPAGMFDDAPPAGYESVLATFTQATQLPPPDFPTLDLTDVDEPWAAFVQEIEGRPQFRADLAAAAEHTYLGMVDGADRVARDAYRLEGTWLLDRLRVREAWRLVREALLYEAERAAAGEGARLSVEDAERGLAEVEGVTMTIDRWESTLLTELERSLITPVDDRRLRLVRWLRNAYLARYDAYFLAAVGVIAGPNLREEVPPWVASNVFSHGGRFVHGASGAEVYWMAILEGKLEVEQARYSFAGRFGWAVLEDGDDLRILVAAGERGDNAFLMPYYFDLSDVESTLELAATLLGGASLHVFRLVDEQELTPLGVERLTFPPDLLDRFADRIDAVLRREEAGAEQPNYLRAFLDFDDEAPVMFSMAEQAKSESLLMFAAAALAPDRKVLAARNAAAQAELARVTAELNDVLTDEHERASSAARESLRVALSRAGRITPRPDKHVLTDIIAEHQAFVHFLSDDRTEKVCVARVVDGAITISLVKDAQLSTERLLKLSHGWLAAVAEGRHVEAESRLAQILDVVGATLLNPLAISLLDTGVEHLVLSPDSALEPLPLHAAPVWSGTLQDLYDISYSPNARLLSTLSSPDNDLELELVISSDGAACDQDTGVQYLAGIEQEGDLLHRLAPSATHLSGDSATCAATEEYLQRVRAAHLMAHGRLSDDRLASGLWLSGRSAGEALLSAAKVEAGPSLASTSLVILSACFSGTHAFGWKGVQSWRGLDAAFLSQGVSAVVGTLWPVDDLAALIYGQELHVQLSAGTDLLVAHHRAVNVLRTGKVDGPSATRLSEVRPSWRTELEGIALNEPYWWAPFRLSGRCWS